MLGWIIYIIGIITGIIITTLILLWLGKILYEHDLQKYKPL